MTSINFEISEGLLHTLNQSRDEFATQVKLWAALQLFQSQKLTLGQAQDLAGMNREQFLLELDKRNIPVIDYDPSDLADELNRFSV
ncbi:MAG: UPF0175 family protein [Chloroflexi bacterium]|nr:MAG: UPF0175 family protein [Chloroflexota bacterium]